MARLPSSPLAWAAHPAPPGQGLHTDIFRAACSLLEAGQSHEFAFRYLRRAADTVGDRRVPDRELHAALADAGRALAGGPRVRNEWPVYSPAYRAEVVATNRVPLAALADSGDALPTTPAFYLSQLYKPHELVCIGHTAYDFATRPASEWTDPHLVRSEYVNPSPMLEVWGETKAGVRSQHTLSNTGPKVYQVVEFDSGTMEEHAAMLRFLARTLPLALIVYSGGKSLHGWFCVRHRTDAEVRAFFADAIAMGADSRMFSACQFARLPAGLNGRSSRQQSVLLFQPKYLSL